MSNCFLNSAVLPLDARFESSIYSSSFTLTHTADSFFNYQLQLYSSLNYPMVAKTQLQSASQAASVFKALSVISSVNKSFKSFSIRDRFLYSTLCVAITQAVYSRVAFSGSVSLLNKLFHKKKFRVDYSGNNPLKGLPVVYSTTFTRQLLRNSKGPKALKVSPFKANIIKMFGFFLKKSAATKQAKSKHIFLEKKNVSVPYSFKLFATNTNGTQPAYYGIRHLKSLLTLVTGGRFSIYGINAVSFARFSFDQERGGTLVKHSSSFNKRNNNQPAASKTSSRFLRSLERERLSRFRYVAVYIQDLIRITFFSIYRKKAAFLVSFLAFTLSKLPRNRKETQFLRFLRKLVKVFASRRKEIQGIRIRFQGRVNRWRRTKHIVGEKGSISFYTYDTRIAYGNSQAITRKGAQGIRL